VDTVPHGGEATQEALVVSAAAAVTLVVVVVVAREKVRLGGKVGAG
jgi:hypothetical protein